MYWGDDFEKNNRPLSFGDLKLSGLKQQAPFYCPSRFRGLSWAVLLLHALTTEAAAIRGLDWATVNADCLLGARPGLLTPVASGCILGL